MIGYITVGRESECFEWPDEHNKAVRQAAADFLRLLPEDANPNMCDCSQVQAWNALACWMTAQGISGWDEVDPDSSDAYYVEHADWVLIQAAEEYINLNAGVTLAKHHIPTLLEAPYRYASVWE